MPRVEPDLESPILRLLREERAALDAADDPLIPASRPDFSAHASATRKALDELREELVRGPVGSREPADAAPATARDAFIRLRLGELDVRLRRVERRLDVPPLGASRG